MASRPNFGDIYEIHFHESNRLQYPTQRDLNGLCDIVGVFVDELANVLATIVSGCSDHLMLCGDVDCASATGLGLDERLSTTLMELGLTQHITQPTRDDRLLDIVASDDAVPVCSECASDERYCRYI